MSLESIFPDLKTNYNSAVDDIVAEIYAPCLLHSDQYFRGTAYFRSSVLSLFSEEILADVPKPFNGVKKFKYGRVHQSNLVCYLFLIGLLVLVWALLGSPYLS